MPSSDLYLLAQSPVLTTTNICFYKCMLPSLELSRVCLNMNNWCLIQFLPMTMFSCHSKERKRSKRFYNINVWCLLNHDGRFTWTDWPSFRCLQASYGFELDWIGRYESNLKVINRPSMSSSPQCMLGSRVTRSRGHPCCPTCVLNKVKYNRTQEIELRTAFAQQLQQNVSL